MDTDTNTEYLTPAQVADMFNVSTMTIYREIKGGHLRAVKVGKSYRIEKDWIDDYLTRTDDDK